MAQGAPVLAGVSNTAVQTTEIVTTGTPSPSDAALKVTNTTQSTGVLVMNSRGSIGLQVRQSVSFAGIYASCTAAGGDALYAVGQYRGLYSVGMTGPGVNSYSYNDNGVKSYGKVNGVFGLTSNSGASGVYGENNGGGWGTAGRTSGATTAGVWGDNLGNGQGVLGTSRGVGVLGRTSGQLGSVGVHGVSSGAGTGVLGETETGTGVVALGGAGIGVYASGERAPLRLAPAPNAGPPTSGNHEIGELVLDSNGSLYLCRASGTPGTWVLVV